GPKLPDLVDSSQGAYVRLNVGWLTQLSDAECVPGGRWSEGAMATRKYLVRVSESAFMHMTLATIAAYDVPRQTPGKGNSARWNETYGLLWGHKISSDR